MADLHITDAAALHFANGRFADPELEAFLRHVRHCEQCGRKTAQYAARCAEDKAELKRILEVVQGRPYRGSLEIFDEISEEMHASAWLEGILAVSFELRYRDPEEMRFLLWGASMAMPRLATRHFNRGRYPLKQSSDLRGKVLIELANAERLNQAFQEAEHTVEEAAAILCEGTGDSMIEGRLLSVRASLLMDQRKLKEALHVISRLHRLYLDLGETHLAGRTLISKAIAFNRANRPREALRESREALAVIDPQRDSKLEATGKQGLIRSLLDCGAIREAGRLLLDSGLRQAFADNPLSLLKVRWQEGYLFSCLGQARRATMILQSVREEFRDRGRTYLVAKIDLQLAAILLQRGKLAEMKGLAREALEIFEDLGVRSEAQAALRYLQS